MTDKPKQVDIAVDLEADADKLPDREFSSTGELLEPDSHTDDADDQVKA